MALNNLMQLPDDQGIAGGLGTLPKKPKLKSAAAVAALPASNPGGYGQLNADAGQPLSTGQKLVNNLRQNGSEFANANLVSYLKQKRADDAYAAAHPAPAAPPAAAGIATPPKPALASPARVNTAAPFQSADPSFNLASAGTGVDTAPQLKSSATAAPGIDSGVTLPGGRKLNYGAMVDGVPTFSDGSGGLNGQPGSIPATINKADIASLGNRLNTVPATAFTAPGAGVTADAAGGAPLSSEQSIATLTRAAQGPKFAMTPQMLAQSDANAVASGDWRSAAGTAAHNLAVEAAAPSTYLQRTRALNSLGEMQDAALKNVADTANNQATLTRTGIAGQNAMDIANLQGRYGLADTQLKTAADLASRQPTQVTSADGTIMQVDPFTHKASPLLDGAGKSVKAATGQLTEKDINDEAIKMLPQLIPGYDPLTQQVKDPAAAGGYRQATPEELAAAMQRGRAMIADQGVPAGGGTAKPTLDQFLTAARTRNPGVSDADLKAYYSKTYGG